MWRGRRAGRQAGSGAHGWHGVAWVHACVRTCARVRRAWRAYMPALRVVCVRMCVWVCACMACPAAGGRGQARQQGQSPPPPQHPSPWQEAHTPGVSCAPLPELASSAVRHGVPVCCRHQPHHPHRPRCPYWAARTWRALKACGRGWGSRGWAAHPAQQCGGASQPTGRQRPAATRRPLPAGFGTPRKPDAAKAGRRRRAGSRAKQRRRGHGQLCRGCRGRSPAPAASSTPPCRAGQWSRSGCTPALQPCIVRADAPC